MIITDAQRRWWFATHGGDSPSTTKTFLWVSGSTRKSVELMIAHNPVVFHGTTDAAKASIEANGFMPSESGTAGPGVYVTDRKTDATFARRDGRPMDAVVHAVVNGSVLDVGRQDGPGPSWSVYLKPHVFAAALLEQTAGRDANLSDLIGNPGSAASIIQSHGYAGISWSFSDGRRAMIVFDPSDISVIRGAH